MTNLFIENSRFNLVKLKENKAFLLELIRQIKESFVIGHCSITDWDDTTEVVISHRSDEYNAHKFYVNGEGVISYYSPSLMVDNKNAKRLEKKYNLKRIQWHAAYELREHNRIIDEKDNYGWVSLEIDNITKDNIDAFIKDIVFAFETKGHYGAYTLRR